MAEHLLIYPRSLTNASGPAAGSRRRYCWIDGLPRNSVCRTASSPLSSERAAARSKARRRHPVPPGNVEIVPDVVYGHKDGMAMTFDVIKPKTAANGAAVIYMVSGGWVSSFTPPQQMATRFANLLDKGFTVIPVRHGSSPKYVIPEIVADVRRAVRFIRHNATQWGVDPDRLGVYGGSAGGHLSLVLATASDAGDPNATEPFMKEGNRVASVVALYPPVDLRTDGARRADPVLRRPGNAFRR